MGNRSSNTKIYNFIKITTVKKIKIIYADMPVSEQEKFKEVKTISTNFRLQDGKAVPFIGYDIKNSEVKIGDILVIGGESDENALYIQIQPNDYNNFAIYFDKFQ